MQPFSAEQQHDNLQIHTYIGPLKQAHIAIDIAEQSNRRTETLPIADSRPLARFQILARNAEYAVTLPAEDRSALSVRRLQRKRVHPVLPLVPKVPVAHVLDRAHLE